MAVELEGNVRMRGDTGPGVGVKVLAEGGRLRLVSGNELVGDWMVSEIGVNALQDGFNIKAEGEEFILRTSDDVSFAEELGVTAVSPRLARRLAARHNPDDAGSFQDAPQISSNLAAIGFAVGGALVVLGGMFLNITAETAPVGAEGGSGGNGSEFWVAFVVGGGLMVGVAFVMSLGARIAQVFATIVLIVVVVVFGIAVSQTEATASQLTAYGFIAGGLVIGVAVLFSGSLSRPD